MANVGHEVSNQAVGNILKANGIEPAPERKRQTSWGTFLKAHWDSLVRISRNCSGTRKSSDLKSCDFSYTSRHRCVSEGIAAIDFSTTEVWTVRGLVTMFVLVVMELKTRRIEIAGVTANPNSVSVQQMARNLTDPQDGFLKNSTHIFIDRDTKFLPLREFLETCTDTEPVVLPPRSPNCKEPTTWLSFLTACDGEQGFPTCPPNRAART